MPALKHAALAWTCAFAIGAAFNGSLRSLTTAAPPALILAAFGCLWALVRSHTHERAGRCHPLLWWALFAGFICSWTVPQSPLPPLSVMTRAPAGMLRRKHAERPLNRRADDDASLFDALERIDRDSEHAIGMWFRVSGTWTRAHDGAPATVSRRIMTCCAADAVSVGFDVIPKAGGAPRPQPAGSRAFVRVSGRLGASMVDGETRYYLKNAVVSVVNTANPP